MTGLGSILLHLDATPGSAARLGLAQALAERHGARVTALFGVRTDDAQPPFAYSAGAALRAAEESATPYDMERARLYELCSEHEPEFLWCDVVGDSLVHGFVGEAAYADLVVLGRPAVANEVGGPPPGFVEAVILQSGTPALVVPHPYRQGTVGDRVLIAWDASPQAARALKAALPFLQRAAQVHVATWSRTPAIAPFSRRDVREWLMRQGVPSPQVHRRDPSSHVADELATLASDLRADLVVMGCYGHSRIREQVFGGVTRSALARLPVPILMAH